MSLLPEMIFMQMCKIELYNNAKNQYKDVFKKSGNLKCVGENPDAQNNDRHLNAEMMFYQAG